MLSLGLKKRLWDALAFSAMAYAMETQTLTGEGAGLRGAAASASGARREEDAVEVLYMLDGRAQQPTGIRSTRCFKIVNQEVGGERTKWIAETKRDKGLETAFSTMRGLGLLSGIGVTVAEDFAPSPAGNEGSGIAEEDSPSEGLPSDLVRQALSTMDPGYSSEVKQVQKLVFGRAASSASGTRREKRGQA